jgi:hypothetical protein
VCLCPECRKHYKGSGFLGKGVNVKQTTETKPLQFRAFFAEMLIVGTLGLSWGIYLILKFVVMR